MWITFEHKNTPKKDKTTQKFSKISTPKTYKKQKVIN